MARRRAAVAGTQGRVALTAIERRVQSAVDRALGQLAQANESIREGSAHRDIKLLLNSSFIHRNKKVLKTRLSQKRIVVDVHNEDGQIAALTTSVLSEERNVRGSFAILERDANVTTTPLPEAIQGEIADIGQVIFILLGQLEGLRACTIQVQGGGVVKVLEIDPGIQQAFVLSDEGKFSMVNLPSLDELLGAVREQAAQRDETVSGEDERRIAKALADLQDEATTSVAMPGADAIDVDNTILGRVKTAVARQVAEYEAAVENYRRAPDNRQNFNEVLRIAYNFSSDALPLVYLIMSACDLKSVLLWCTLDKQIALESTINALPWNNLGEKASLEAYHGVISNARSHAFHHIWPFDSTCEVDLRQSSVQAEYVRLFAPYGKDKGRLRVVDQELLDVFTQFSRGHDRTVADNFWSLNVAVLRAVRDLVGDLLDSLVELHSANRRLAG
ncbi:MAG: hypothetical protein H6839_14650 [Planctomycetes bacterium]|nr:hypothetical protein [Planctomycetota bacterium]